VAWDYHTAMPSLRLRQLMAGPVIFFFALFWIEAAVANVHDEDAPQATLSEQGSMHDASRTPGSQRPSSPNDDGHPLHACHCNHAHSTAWVSLPFEVAFSPAHRVPPCSGASAHTPTPEQQPLDRPPIA
jgi:hypothetical protein